jgi:hypothetical protein
MSVYFEGNAYIDSGTVVNTTISNCSITTSSLDMNLANITSVKDPILQQDAATKQYVDDLGIVIKTISLTSTTTTQIFDYNMGSFVITITNLVNNGPSGVFNVTKNNSTKEAHIVRTVAAVGNGTDTSLKITWPPNSGILLSKTGNDYDGSYKVKLM